MTSSLWPASPSSVTVSGAINVATNYGIAFIPDVTQYLHGARWYRGSLLDTNVATSMTVWDTTTGEPVANFRPVSVNSFIGWQETYTGSVIELVAGREYRVSAFFEGSNTRTVAYVTSAPSDPANDLAFATTKYRFLQGAYGYPNSTASNFYPLVDVITDDVPPPEDAGQTATTIGESLFAWLTSTTDNTHKLNGLPWLSYELLQTEQTALAAAQAAIDDLQDKFGTALGPLGNLATGALRTRLDLTKDAVDAIKAKIDASLTDTTGTVYTRLDAIDGKLDTLVPTLPAPPETPGGSWAITDTGSEVGPAIIDGEADFYTITIDPATAGTRRNTYAGQDFLTFPWWWAPIRGGAVGLHHTSMALQHDAYEPGRRLPAALVVVPPTFEWTWESWTYTA